MNYEYWLKGITDKAEADKLKNLLQNNLVPLDKLIEICYNVINEIEFKTDYDSPNWAAKQAHNNGKVEALKLLIKISTNKGT